MSKLLGARHTALPPQPKAAAANSQSGEEGWCDCSCKRGAPRVKSKPAASDSGGVYTFLKRDKKRGSGFWGFPQVSVGRSFVRKRNAKPPHVSTLSFVICVRFWSRFSRVCVVCPTYVCRILRHSKLRTLLLSKHHTEHPHRLEKHRSIQNSPTTSTEVCSQTDCVALGLRFITKPHTPVRRTRAAFRRFSEPAVVLPCVLPFPTCAVYLTHS